MDLSMKMIDYLYWGMLLISLILISIALMQYRSSKKLLGTGIKAVAEVIDLIEVSSDDGYTYKPVFRYADFNEQQLTFTSDVSSRPAAHNIGDFVDIVYDPVNDEQKVVSYWGLYRWSIILLCIAAPLLIIGGGYVLYSRS